MPNTSSTGASIPTRDQASLSGSSDPKAIWDGIGQLRTDIMALKYRLQGLLNAKLNLSALTSVACPFAGIANLYASSTVGFALSGVNYWKIQGIRQSFAEQSNYKSNQADAITAYEEFFLGSFTVGQGDVLSIVLTQTGAPAALTVANITVRCELTPKDLGNA